MLSGKIALITGGSRGIGRQCALTLAGYHAEVIINYNGSEQMAKKTVGEIEKMGGKAHAIKFSVSDYEASQEAVKSLLEQFGHIDILINNAGITNDKLMLRMKPEEFDQVLKINLVGTFNMTQQVLKKMLKQREGAIINLSSVSGLIGNVGQANYAASKAGVVGFTKSVAREVAPRGITCNAIAPGFIQTDMTDVLSDKVKEQVTQNIPLQRFGQVEDVAQTAIFLAKNPYITGQVINVDGGLVMHG